MRLLELQGRGFAEQGLRSRRQRRKDERSQEAVNRHTEALCDGRCLT
jgi:hypothetical protein